MLRIGRAALLSAAALLGAAQAMAQSSDVEPLFPGESIAVIGGRQPLPSGSEPGLPFIRLTTMQSAPQQPTVPPQVPPAGIPGATAGSDRGPTMADALLLSNTPGAGARNLGLRSRYPNLSIGDSAGTTQQTFNGYMMQRVPPDLGAPGSPGNGFFHFTYPMDRYTTWYRPRAATLTAEQRCAPDHFRPRGLGHMFARPCDGYRMEYQPYVLQDGATIYGPAYIARQPDPRCPHCDHVQDDSCPHCR